MMRPIPLRRYITVMQDRGFSAEQVLRGSGVTVDALDDPHYLVELPVYLHVVENVVRLSGDQGIGLDMGLAREASDFRILGYAAMVCRTVRQSMQDVWYRYGDALGMMAKIALSEVNAATATADIIVVNASPTTYRFFVEEALCVLLKVGHQVSGTPPQFEKLQFAYPEPTYSQRYNALFNCPIRYGAGQTQLRLGRAWLDQPLGTNDPELLQLYQRNLEQLKLEIESSSSTSMRLRQILLTLVSIPSLDQAARMLGLSPRTLRRRLHEEGLSYRRLVESFRVECAIESIRCGTLTTKQLSARIGFDDVNAFRRAFKRWTGQTIRSYHASETTDLD